MELKENYEKIYGDDLNWENLESFLKNLVRTQQENIANKYVESTTMTSGKFVGDRRIAEMIANTPIEKR